MPPPSSRATNGHQGALLLLEGRKEGQAGWPCCCLSEQLPWQPGDKYLSISKAWSKIRCLNRVGPVL